MGERGKHYAFACLISSCEGARFFFKGGGLPYSDGYEITTFIFLVSWFRGSARSSHISFHTVKYYASCPLY